MTKVLYCTALHCTQQLQQQLQPQRQQQQQQNNKKQDSKIQTATDAIFHVTAILFQLLYLGLKNYQPLFYIINRQMFVS